MKYSYERSLGIDNLVYNILAMARLNDVWVYNEKEDEYYKVDFIGWKEGHMILEVGNKVDYDKIK